MTMKLQHLLTASTFVLTLTSAQAQSEPVAKVETEFFNSYRRNPPKAVVAKPERIELVNARFEPCASKKEALYLREVTPVSNGYLLRVVKADGRVMMTGASSDPHGKVLNGHFRYYDEGGTLRAEGDYVNGQKIGTWTRFDDRGAELPAKEYDGLDWDAKQIKLGLASLSASLGDVAAE
jgi:hypothetical protein